MPTTWTSSHDLVVVEPDRPQRFEIRLDDVGRVERELLGVGRHRGLALRQVGLTPVDGDVVRRLLVLRVGAQRRGMRDDAVVAPVDARDDDGEQLAVGVAQVSVLVHEEVEVVPPGEELVSVDRLRREDVGHEAERLLRLGPRLADALGDVVGSGDGKEGDARVVSHDGTVCR